MDDVNIIEELLKNPVGVGTLALNLLVAGINLYISIRVFNRRRIEDREFNAENELFKSLVVPSLAKILAHYEAIEARLTDLSREYAKPRNTTDKLRAIATSAQNELDKQQEQFEKAVLPIFSCYSDKMAAELLDISTQLHDQATTIYGQFSLSNTNSDKQRASLAKHKKDSIERIAQTLRKYNPHRNHIDKKPPNSNKAKRIMAIIREKKQA